MKSLRFINRNKVKHNSRNHSVHLYDSEEKEKVAKLYCKNLITTTQYTWYNFIFKSLFEQLTKISNFWFLTTLIFFFFAETPLSINSTVIPLVIVIGFSMSKDAFADIRRYIRDKKFNETKYFVIRPDSVSSGVYWQLIDSKDIRVGDFIRVDSDIEFPCDLLAVASTNITREIYVVTANLDGETSIKKFKPISSSFETLRKVPKDAHSKNPYILDPFKFKYELEVNYMNPNKNLELFYGGATSKDARNIKFDSNNLLLRGAKLRHTDFIVGVAVYTGKDTKLSLNTRKASKKFSAVEKKLNSNICILIIISVTLTLVIKTLQLAFFNVKILSLSWYIPQNNMKAWKYFQEILNSLLIYLYLIPISIIIAYEIVQLFSAAIFINMDLELKDPKTGLKVVSNVTSLADQLGQIEFLFSDKTGTLTENLMQFKACNLVSSESVYFREENGLIKEEMIYNSTLNIKKNDQSFPLTPALSLESLASSTDSGEVRPHNPMSPYTTLSKTLLDEYTEDFFEFWIMVTLCNTVVVDDNSARSTEPSYTATSPDEEALVVAAAEMGLKFVGNMAQQPFEELLISSRKESIKRHKRSSSDVQQEHLASLARKRRILVSPKLFPQNNLSKNDPEARELIFEVDDIIEFTSERKRMTILCTYPDGRHFILSKGAETSMTDPLSCTGSTDEERSRVLRKVTDFALMGLRTLVFSMKEIYDTNKYRSLLDQLMIARSCTSFRRKEMLKNAIDAIENDMKLIGVTGVEDKLQDGVKEALEALREAGIQVWVLTGDKEETAISVSQAAGHFPSDLSLVRIVDCNSISETMTKINDQSEGLRIRLEQRKRNEQLIHSLKLTDKLPVTVKKLKKEKFSKWLFNETSVGRIRRRRKKHAGAAGEGIGLVVDGKSLEFALLKILRDSFLELCMNCTTVLCCRVTPLQKAGVVQMVSEGIAKSSFDKRPVTAAIGDGGNDVSMILQADVGIGIFGKEGLHAVRSSDFAIPKFSYIIRLLFIHGSYTYQRLSLMMLYFYAKCTCLVAPDAFQALFNGWSDQALFFSYYYGFFNLSMTSLTSLVYGIQDKFLSIETLIKFPRIYRTFTRNINLSCDQFFLWLLFGLWQGTVAYFVGYFFLAGGAHSPAIFWDNSSTTPYDVDLYIFSNCVYIYFWIASTLHCFLMFRIYDPLIIATFIFTIAINIPTFYLLQALFMKNADAFNLTINKVGPCPNFWVGLLLVLGVSVLPSFLWKLFRDWYFRVEVAYAQSFHKNQSVTSKESIQRIRIQDSIFSLKTPAIDSIAPKQVLPIMRNEYFNNDLDLKTFLPNDCEEYFMKNTDTNKNPFVKDYRLRASETKV